MAETFNEQKVLYNWEKRFAELFLPVAAALGATRLHHPVTRWGNEVSFPHAWELGRKTSGKHKGWHKYKTVVYFDGISYVDGEPEIGKAVKYRLEDEGRGWSQTYYPKAAGVKQTIREKIELQDESWSEYTMNSSFNVTHRTSASAGVEAGPAKAEVKTENEVSFSTSFGMDRGQRLSRTYEHEIVTEVEADVGENIVVSCDVFKEKVVTPIVENGYIEATMRLDLSDWADDAKPLRDSKAAKERFVIKCNSIQDLIDFLEGNRVTEYPNMRGFLEPLLRPSSDWWSAKGTRDFYHWIKNKENRRVQLRKERVRIYETAGEVRTNFVEGG